MRRCCSRRSRGASRARARRRPRGEPRGDPTVSALAARAARAAGPIALRPLLLAVGAGALGYLLNGFTVGVLQDVMFVFGGVLALVVAAAFGPVPGVVAAAIAGLRTVQLWHHP